VLAARTWDRETLRTNVTTTAVVTVAELLT
jgi:hypothetical protein